MHATAALVPPHSSSSSIRVSAMSAPASSAGSSASADNAAVTAASSSGTKRAFPGAAAAADDDRRVQPRHFHAGPNPIASSHAEASPESGPLAADRLYRHVLESIFAILDRGELVSVLQVSRGWLGAVQTMVVVGLEIHGPSPTSPWSAT